MLNYWELSIVSLFEYIKSNPLLSELELCDVFKCTHTWLRSRLEDDGVFGREKVGREYLYYVKDNEDSYPEYLKDGFYGSHADILVLFLNKIKNKKSDG